MTAGLLSDFRHGFRQLLHSPAFTLPAIGGLALSLGAGTAVFSIAHATLLQSLGFTDVDRVVSVWSTDPGRAQHHVELCYADLEDFRKQTAIFEDVALVSSVNLDVPLLDGGEPQQVDAATVSGAFFRVLGAKPALGRLIEDHDDRPGAPVRLVLSHRLFVSRYGGDPSVIGRQIQSGDSAATIIGVTAPEFDYPRDVDMFIPLQAAWPGVEKQRLFRVFRGIAKIADGLTVADARQRMDVVAGQIAETRPAGETAFGVLLTPLLDEIYGPARPAIWLLLAAVLLVVLVACANVANLLLARATVRDREFALRSVLGAGRGRLVALLVVEAFAMSAAASVLAIGIGRVLIAALARLAPPEVPRMDQVAMSLPVLAFGLGLTLATVLLFGLGPAIVASRRDPNDTLRQGGRGMSADRAHSRFRNVLVASEVALSVVLLVGAALLIRSFQQVASLSPGFDPENVLTFRITTNIGPQEARRKLYTEVLDRVRSLPGVKAAGAVLLRPLSGIVGWDTEYTAAGQAPEEQLANRIGNYQAISPGYFDAMRIRLLAGRDFTHGDADTAPGVVIVNESTARRYWPDGNAIGQRIRLSKDSKAPFLTIVGVVNDVRYREWEAVRPDFYIPYTQRAQHRSDFVVRTQGDPTALVAAIRKEVFAIDKNQPISNVTTMSKLVDRALSRAKFISVVLTALAACALLLSALGIYGVLSYTVAQRAREIGVRMALGARPRDVLAAVARSGLWMTAIGACIGIAVSIALTRVVSAVLFGVGFWDPFAWTAALVLLLSCAIVACILPASRAARIDPARALAVE